VRPCLNKRTSGIQALLAFVSCTTAVNHWRIKLIKLVSALYIHSHKRLAKNFELFSSQINILTP
jgi:hypothetical protein